MSKLNQIEVDGFRNLKSINIVLHPRANLIFGDNGAGKSNLLEAIYYLCYLRSFRYATEQELIGLDNNGFSIKGKNDRQEGVVRLKSGKKKVLLNGIEKKRYSDYAGWNHCVVFSLGDIWIIRGSPYQRRDWLNSLLIKLQSGYYRKLIEYRSILKQRNQLLAQRRSDGELDVWTERLVSVGRRIYQFRSKIFPEIKDQYNHIAKCLKLDTTIDYQPSTDPESFRAEIDKLRSKELELCQTTIGPHRDEIVITKGDYPMRGYGSEGEQRLAGITLRLIEEELFKKRKKQPILLLDEPLIEIDHRFRKRIEELLMQRGQLIMASTSEIQWDRKFNIVEGKIETTS